MGRGGAGGGGGGVVVSQGRSRGQKRPRPTFSSDFLAFESSALMSLGQWRGLPVFVEPLTSRGNFSASPLTPAKEHTCVSSNAFRERLSFCPSFLPSFPSFLPFVFLPSRLPSFLPSSVIEGVICGSRRRVCERSQPQACVVKTDHETS